jgi:hypothetical protein
VDAIILRCMSGVLWCFFLLLLSSKSEVIIIIKDVLYKIHCIVGLCWYNSVFTLDAICQRRLEAGSLDGGSLRARGRGSLLTCCETAQGTPGRPAPHFHKLSVRSTAQPQRTKSSQDAQLRSIALQAQPLPNATVGLRHIAQHRPRSKAEFRPLIGLSGCSVKALGQTPRNSGQPGQKRLGWGGADQLRVVPVVVDDEDQWVLDVVDLGLSI